MPIGSKRTRKAASLARYLYRSSAKRMRAGPRYGPFRSSSRKVINRGGVSRNVHFYKRWGQPSTNILTGPSTEQSWADKFTLNEVVNSGELISLYDQYKITCVVVKFQLLTNPDIHVPPGGNASTANNNPMFYPRLWYYRDYDDENTLTLQQMREIGKAKFKVLRPNTTISVKLKPAVAMQVYRTAVTTGYAPMWPKRLDCAANDIPHYGLKYVLDTGGVVPWNNGQFQLRVERQYYLKMYNTQ